MTIRVQEVRAGTVLVFGMATACAPVGPDFVRPQSTPNESWSDFVREDFQFEPQERVEWWEVFDDPVLSQLVMTAHQNNNNIRLAGLVMGPRIFAGPAMHPEGATWSYGYLTMIVVLALAVLDMQSGAPAGAAFWARLEMFVWATIYGTGAVFVFDTLWRRKPTSDLN